MEYLIILPNQLFSIRYLPKNKIPIILWEHPHFFVDYNYNKKKLVLHRASMRYYFDYLQKNKYRVKYIEYHQKFEIEKSAKIKMFDSINKLKFKFKISEILESPNFLLTIKLYEKYRNYTDKYVFNNFYMKAKYILDIIPKIKSLDKENREKYPKKKISFPKLPKVQSSSSKYITEAGKYVTKHFPKNIGDISKFNYPVTHSDTKKFLLNFIKTRIKNFGKYQDIIDREQSVLYHSCLSSSINIGLINPLEIVVELKKNKSKIPINSYEGYIRQLFWREYQRYTYIYFDFSKHNYFGNSNRLTKEWYDGTTGIDPVDKSILKFEDTGYLNHIERLMVVGNYMNLCQIKPTDGFRWFMEMSIDSYEWVMHQNVLDMVFCVTGGKTMKRPYISSSNYILNMSNYKKGDWCAKFDEKFHEFTHKNREKLKKFRYYFSYLFRQ